MLCVGLPTCTRSDWVCGMMCRDVPCSTVATRLVALHVWAGAYSVIYRPTYDIFVSSCACVCCLHCHNTVCWSVSVPEHTSCGPDGQLGHGPAFVCLCCLQASTLQPAPLQHHAWHLLPSYRWFCQHMHQGCLVPVTSLVHILIGTRHAAPHMRS